MKISFRKFSTTMLIGVLLSAPAFAQFTPASIEFYSDEGEPLPSGMKVDFCKEGNVSYTLNEATNDPTAGEGLKYQHLTGGSSAQELSLAFTDGSPLCSGSRRTGNLGALGYDMNSSLRYLIKFPVANVTANIRIKYVDRNNITHSRQYFIPAPNAANVNVWFEQVIPIQDFGADPNDTNPTPFCSDGQRHPICFESVAIPFNLTPAGIAGTAPNIMFDHIRWTKDLKDNDGITNTPASIVLAPGESRQLTTRGHNLFGEAASVYSKFTPSTELTNLGVTVSPVIPTRSMTGIIKAGSSIGGPYNLGIEAIDMQSGPTGRARTFVTKNVSVTVANLAPENFGVLSDSLLGVSLFNVDRTNPNPLENAKLVAFCEESKTPVPANCLPLIQDDVSEYVEGHKSLKTILKPKTVKQWQGWAIRWGTEEIEDNTAIRDFSRYYSGAIKFWFKAPPTDVLIKNLTVGIRSGNVYSGGETSKFLLKDVGAKFTGDWEPITIPLSQLAKSKPWADLTQMKILFNISLGNADVSSSLTESQRTFWVDNIRWDTQLPGPLASLAVTPNPVTVPVHGFRQFYATGYDSSNPKRPIDVAPVWTALPGSGLLGRLTPHGSRLSFAAGSKTQSGSITATVGSLSATANVTVGPLTPTQTLNIYSDQGLPSSAVLGVSTGVIKAVGTELGIDELHPNPSQAAEGFRFLRATYTLVDSAPQKFDSFAGLFVAEKELPRFLRFYESGYIHFFVRTATNLEISIRSENMDENSNKAKFTLDELGAGYAANTWTEVVLALADFKSKDGRLDFSRIKTYFSIGVVSAQNGTNSVVKSFDVDDVEWWSTDPRTFDINKVYKGLQNKQNTKVGSTGNGLVRSFDNQDNAFTYDQALAAMAYSYHRDFARAEAIFDRYKVFGMSSGSFKAFANNYNVNTGAIIDGDMTAGPNAWMLLALIHYDNAISAAHGTPKDYGQLRVGIASWILYLQSLRTKVDSTFGGTAVPFGIKGDGITQINSVSTEHNFDCYAALMAYDAFTPKIRTYRIAAGRILSWLKTTNKGWNAVDGRFNIGFLDGGSLPGTVPNKDVALDLYSWAPLALSNYTALLPQAEVLFGNTHINDKTLETIKGFDFAGSGIGSSYDRKSINPDAVWLEGTAQMVLAYLAADDEKNANFYLEELKKAVFTIEADPTTQGITYATNPGTFYKGTDPKNLMDSQNASLSSSAWLLFAYNRFNPFKVFPLHSIEIRNISNNLTTNNVTWDNPDPNSSSWVRAAQFVKIDFQTIMKPLHTETSSWGLQIYTDNMDPAFIPHYVDLSPAIASDYGSNPSGLMEYDSVNSTSSEVIPLAWSIKDTLAPEALPKAVKPAVYGEGATEPNSFQWFWTKDINTHDVDMDGNGKFVFDPKSRDFSKTSPDVKGFTAGEPFVLVKSNLGIHHDQGDNDFSPSLSPDYLFFEADFSHAATQTTYIAKIVLEYFSE